MVPQGIILMSQTARFSEDIRDWQQQSNKLKMWSHLKIFFHRSNQYQRRAVTTAGKGGYTVAVQNIYGVPPPPLEEHHEAIGYLNKKFKGCRTRFIRWKDWRRPMHPLLVQTIQ